MLEPFGALIIILRGLGVKVFVCFTWEKRNKVVLFIEAEHFRFVLGINYGEATAGLVVFTEKPHSAEPAHC